MVALRHAYPAITEVSTPPPPGSPYGVPLPASARPGRTAIYRHWRMRDRPLMWTYDPNIQTIHDLFENSVHLKPTSRCLGARRWDPARKEWDDRFTWQTFAEVAERRKRLGAGIMELHRAMGITEDKFAVGLWCQNRPEWHTAGRWSSKWAER